MTSRELAKLNGIWHFDMIKKIEKLQDAYTEVFGMNEIFRSLEFTDSRGRKQAEFVLNKSQSLFIASNCNPVLQARVQKR